MWRCNGFVVPSRGRVQMADKMAAPMQYIRARGMMSGLEYWLPGKKGVLLGSQFHINISKMCM